MAADLTALYDEDATLDEQVKAYQHLIDTGSAWLMDGSTGRAAMALIESGHCVLPQESHRDAYGNRVPARQDVEPGTKGTVEYAVHVNPDGPRGWE